MEPGWLCFVLSPCLPLQDATAAFGVDRARNMGRPCPSETFDAGTIAQSVHDICTGVRRICNSSSAQYWASAYPSDLSCAFHRLRRDRLFPAEKFTHDLCRRGCDPVVLANRRIICRQAELLGLLQSNRRRPTKWLSAFGR